MLTEQTSLALEEEGINDDSRASEWLRLLIAQGSSLGDARPKANVQDSNGSLWIAKFPSKNDDYDKGMWKSFTCYLAFACGISVPANKCVKYSHHHTFLSKWFDRDKGRRIHFASPMTLLGATNGEDGYSYFDFAGFLTKNGIQPKWT